MIVTTAYRTNEQLNQKAQAMAIELNGEFVPRSKKTIKEIGSLYNQEVLVLEKDNLQLFMLNTDQPFFFHPNSAMFRVKRLMNGDKDPFLEVCQLKEGDSLLDCTLGMGSDAIVASYATKKSGCVKGLEANRLISYIVKNGLSTYKYDLNHDFLEAMRRIEVINIDSLEYLRQQGDQCVDVIYFDPMFSKPIEESKGIDPLRKLALIDGFSNELLEEAKRVGRRRIVLKDHYLSPRFNEHGFNVLKRKSAQFHFGYIDLKHNT